MPRINRHRRPSSTGRLVLFLAGGLGTAILLVVVLVSLEEQSPIQGAIPDSSPGGIEIRKAPAPSLKEPASAALPETFTFYETLEQRSRPSSKFMEEPTSTSPRPAPPPSPSVVIKKTGKKPPTQYSIQVASVKDRSTAEALSQRLKRKGYSAFILPHDIPKRGVWYRVRVGHFAKRDDAREMVQKLSSREGLTAYIAKE